MTTTKKISELTELTIAENNDVLVINDVSAGETKKITVQNLSEPAKNVTWFKATSADVTVTANTFTEVINLPFYVSSSNSNIIVEYNWVGISGNGQQCSNYSHLYLDGTRIGGSSYTRTPFASVITTTHNMDVVTASVGWHTASLQIKNDLTAITIDWNTNKMRVALKVTEEK